MGRRGAYLVARGPGAPAGWGTQLHYCSHAGMGVLVPTKYELSEDLMELFAHFECGIFKIKSKREISVSLTSIGYPEEVIFTKQQ